MNETIQNERINSENKSCDIQTRLLTVACDDNTAHMSNDCITDNSSTIIKQLQDSNLDSVNNSGVKLETDKVNQITQIKAKDKLPEDRTFEDLEITLGDAITNEAEAKPFKDLITQYSDCFALDNSELTGYKLAQCSFQLKD